MDLYFLNLVWRLYCGNMGHEETDMAVVGTKGQIVIPQRKPIWEEQRLLLLEIGIFLVLGQFKKQE